LPSESPAFRVDHRIGASGKRPTIPDGNGALERALFDELRNRGQRAFVKERATCGDSSIFEFAQRVTKHDASTT
jgi:hypothetical protein